jgi:hypothetical protein
MTSGRHGALFRQDLVSIFAADGGCERTIVCLVRLYLRTIQAFFAESVM